MAGFTDWTRECNNRQAVKRIDYLLTRFSLATSVPEAIVLACHMELLPALNRIGRLLPDLLAFRFDRHLWTDELAIGLGKTTS